MTRKTSIAAVSAAAVAVVVWVVWLRWEPGEAGRTLRVSGNVEITDAEIAFRLPGFVAERLVSEGETVRRDEVVARLDDRELAREVGVREAEVRGARAALAELEAGFRSEEIEEAEATLALARAEAERLELEFRRQSTLYEKDVVSAREFETAQAGIRVARARVAESSARAALLRNGPRPEQIEQTRARLAQAEEALGLARTRLGWATLRSPLTGIVLSENVEPGEYVTAGTPVVTVGEIGQVWLRAYVDERDLGRVKVGQTARLRTDSYPDRTYEGRVSFIASEAEFTPKTVQTEKERVKLVYRVKIDVPNPAMELKPGMPADAEILLD